MKRLIYLFTILFALLLACNKNNKQEQQYICNECHTLFSDKLYMWVANKYYIDPDNRDKKCLKVQIERYVSDTSWVPFCDTICGFDYEPGYRYQLFVERKKVGEDSTGQTLYKYCLLYVKSKTLEPMK